MKKNVFKGAGVALVTPFDSDNNVDFVKLEDLIEFQIKSGTDAIIVCGTTGESSTLSDNEHFEIIKRTLKKVNNRIPVIAGAGSNNTMHAIKLSRQAESLGVDGLLIVTPYYNKTSQEGLIKHYFAIADSVNIPIILYDVPSRTGVTINPTTCKELSKHPNIVALKDATGNLSKLGETISLCGSALQIYSGNDDLITASMSLGAIGAISVLSNINPKLVCDITRLALEGDFELSRKLQLKNLKLINKLFSDVNPIPIKDALNMMGFNVGICRPPLYNLSVQNKQELNEELHKCELIDKEI